MSREIAECRTQRWRRVLAACSASIALMSCTRGVELNEAELSVLALECRQLLDSTGDQTEFIARGSWPPSVNELAPKKVFVRSTGIYVTLNEWFVTESGYFVPRNPDQFVPSRLTDPSYEYVAKNVYWYKVRG